MKTWKKVTFGDILTESKVVSENSNPDRRITVRLNVKGVEKRGYESSIEGATKYFTRRTGQFIYGKQNLFKGAFGIVPPELDGLDSSSDIPAFDVSKDCLPEWIIYFLRQGDFYKSLEGIAKGTGSRRIHPEHLYKVEFPLPSVAEQKELIKKFRIAEEKYSDILSELTTQQTLITQLRQSILQEAVQGKLVKQNKNDEPASELLKRIKAEKEKLIKQGKLKKEKPLPPISENEIPFQLPEGWVWCRMSDIAYVGNGSTPSQSEFTNSTSDIPYLKVYNIVKQKVNFLYKPQYVKRSCHNGQLKRSISFSGDVLMNIVGPPLGKIAIIPDEIPECNINQAIVVIRPFEKKMNTWIYWYLVEGKEVESIVTKGTAGQDNISVTQSRSMRIPLPPLPEQKRIVEKVNQLMQHCNELEQQVQQSITHAQQLMQAVLREVFENKKEYKINEAVGMAAEG